jgi:fumarate reductase subunit C
VLRFVASCDGGMNDATQQARLWYWQRISAMVLTLCVLVHLITIVYAVRSGLSADALLARTHGNLPFALFYVVFLLACVVHVPIGLARIGEEWLGMTASTANFAARMFALLLLLLGLTAVYAVAWA